MRLTKKHETDNYYFPAFGKLEGMGDQECSMRVDNAIWNKLGQLEDLMEKYEFETIEDLEKTVVDFDNCCQDLINMTGMVMALNAFIKSKGLYNEGIKYVNEYLKDLKDE